MNIQTEDILSRSIHNGSAPKDAVKAQFAAKLWRLLRDKGWTQSDLHRRAGLGRDVISSYVRKQSLPTPRNAQKLADAFGVPVEALLPQQVEDEFAKATPSIELRESMGSEGVVWLKVNTQMPIEVALEVLGLLRGRGVVSHAA